METRVINQDELNFDDLPTEIYLLSFIYLSYKDLLSVSQTSKKYRSIFRISSFWKPKIRDEFFCQAPNKGDVVIFYENLLYEKNKIIISCSASVLMYYFLGMSNLDYQNLLRKPSRTLINQIFSQYHFYPNHEQDTHFKANCINFPETVLALLLSLPAGTLNSENLKDLVLIASSSHTTLSPNQLDKLSKIIGKTGDMTGEQYIKLAEEIFFILSNICYLGLRHLYQLIISKHPDLAKTVLSKYHHASLLHNAILGLRYRISKSLIQAGADVNQTTACFQGNSISYPSPLYLALSNITSKMPEEELNRSKKLIRLLLDHQADPNLACVNLSGDQTTPLELSKSLRKNTKRPLILEICRMIGGAHNHHFYLKKKCLIM